MAKQSGPVRIRGKVGGLSFFMNQYGYFVKEHKAVNGERIKKDPAFVRTRENMSEFTSAAKNGKVFRHSVAPLINGIADNAVSSRLTKMMSELKKLDTSSVKGERNAAVALNTPQGKALLKEFNFNKACPVDKLLVAPFVVDPVLGGFSLNGFIPKSHLRYPENATHVTFRGAWVKLDLTQGAFETVYTNAVNLPIDDSLSNVQLNVANAPSMSGCSVFLVAIEMFTETNGQQYLNANQQYSACSVVDVA